MKEDMGNRFCNENGLAAAKTYFQKMEEHRITYKSGGRNSQVDCILRRRENLKGIEDCKVLVGESVAKQHRVVLCRIKLVAKKRKKERIAPKIK